MKDASAVDSDSVPKVSCVMVTADRRAFCRRSLRCFNRQTYPNREIVVVDDGQQDLRPALADIPEDQLRYVKLSSDEDHVLGALRNVGLEAATGDFIVQWDDDDWYHAERIERQAAALQQGYDACSLHGALMHIDAPEFAEHPYVGYLQDGVPGTIMHRRDLSIRYPEQRRAEDTVFLDQWRNRDHVRLSGSNAYLFIRCFHGGNTWDKSHFLTRIHNTPKDLVLYMWHRFIRGNLFGHPRFQLSDPMRDAFRQFLDDSRQLNLLQSERMSAQSWAS